MDNQQALIGGSRKALQQKGIVAEKQVFELFRECLNVGDGEAQETRW